MALSLTDRELDQWIQENVFNACWHVYEKGEYPMLVRCIKCRELHPGETNRFHCLSLYSASEVVHKMEERGFFLHLDTGLKAAEFYKEFRNMPCISETVGRAICEAAFYALRGAIEISYCICGCPKANHVVSTDKEIYCKKGCKCRNYEVI